MDLTKQTTDLLVDPTDMDHKLILNSRTTASIAFDAENYDDAEEYLKKIWEQSLAKYGPKFEWRETTQRMLFVVAEKKGNWQELQKLLLERLKVEYEEKDE